MQNIKIESTEYPDFYYVPSLKNTLINISGIIIDIEKQWCPIPIMNIGYLRANSEGDSQAIHRLLALTFLPIPDTDVNRLDVNHIDGIKINNSIDNLEWATRSKNCFHAYETGLRSDNRPVLVKDLRDDSIVRYYSLQECARAFNKNGGQIHTYLRDYNREKVSLEYYVFIYEGQEWPNLSKDDIGSWRKGLPKAMLATNLDNTKTHIFESCAEAANYFKYIPGTLSMHVSRHGIKPYHGWIFRYIDDPSLLSMGKVAKRQLDWKRTPQKPVPIRVTNIQTNEIKYWDSTEEFGNSLGVSKNTIQAGANRHNGIWKQHKVEYLNR